MKLMNKARLAPNQDINKLLPHSRRSTDSPYHQVMKFERAMNKTLFRFHGFCITTIILCPLSVLGLYSSKVFFAFYFLLFLILFVLKYDNGMSLSD